MADLSEARRRREEELLEQQGTLRHTVSRLQGTSTYADSVLHVCCEKAYVYMCFVDWRC